MGCPCSKAEDLGEEPRDEEDLCNYSAAVSQCKQRKELLRQASQAGRAFAKSHAEFLQSLARTGCALQDFLTGELGITDGFRAAPAPARSSFAIEYTPTASQRVVLEDEFLAGIKPPPPPPGLPSRYWDFDFFQQVEQSIAACSSSKEIHGGDDEEDTVIEMEGDDVKIREIEHHCSNPSPATRERRDSNASVASLSSDGPGDRRLAIVPAELPLHEIEKIFRYVYQEFLRASQSGAAVAGILQSGRELGLALTWKNGDHQVTDCNYGWSQALTLERLSAWELKLYEEVKALNSIDADFNKKRKLLCKYDVNRVHDETVDRTRADVKAIENQMSVAVQAMEATAAAVQKITNEELHYQLLELVQGLADMWKSIQDCHERQRAAVLDLRLPRGAAAKEINPGQRKTAQKLQLALLSWSFSLNELITKEKEYISSIMQWLKASISKLNKLHSLSRKKSRVMHLAIPEIYFLCQEWEKSLNDLSKERSGQVIRKLTVAASKIEWYQMEQIKAQKRVSGLVKDLDKKVAGVKNLEKKALGGRKDAPGNLAEKRASLELFRQQVDQEKKKLAELNSSRASFTLGSTESCLPELFGSASSSAKVLVKTHQELHGRAKNGLKQSIVK
ncbi:nitrate regulatory gene2 protein [Selaginella moellendorffii]|uniref:nitrate regulatory gene2 protein n=1 Tax=Selaginella moellendorffii TaxID=88036 RepID=UPI000D1CDCE3|nr:nitrate regulatory gene2 protein [Selaginella moellendorffii]|eukprot:XP_024527700.1 nitrate regulatory gene2 protein [Selaginella moellendorffii]